jgi:hypothetical protein
MPYRAKDYFGYERLLTELYGDHHIYHSTHSHVVYCEGVGSSTTTRQRGKGGVYRTMYGKLPAGESQARRARPALRREKKCLFMSDWQRVLAT